MRKDDSIRLRHMLEAAHYARSFVAGKTRDDLADDVMLVLALLKAIEIIGEAASKVSSDSRDLYSTIAWQDIIAMRNRLTHAYFNVNLGIVWSTVTEDLPPLIAELNTILASYDQP